MSAVDAPPTDVAVAYGGFWRRLTFANSLGRWAAKILSAVLLGIGFLMVAFTHRKRGLHDMLAGTLVVRMAPETGPATRLPA